MKKFLFWLLLISYLSLSFTKASEINFEFSQLARDISNPSFKANRINENVGFYEADSRHFITKDLLFLADAVTEPIPTVPIYN